MSNFLCLFPFNFSLGLSSNYSWMLNQIIYFTFFEVLVAIRLTHVLLIFAFFFVHIDLEMFAILKLEDVKVLDVNVDNEWNN